MQVGAGQPGCRPRQQAGASSRTPEGVCPAGLLSGGGLAVVCGVPAGLWLTLMCRDARSNFTCLKFSWGTAISDTTCPSLAVAGLPCGRCPVLITLQSL